MSIDPRLAERRVEVAEERAKRNVWRLLRFFLLLAIGGGVVWFVLSPWMSIARVTTTGVLMSDTERILREHGIAVGTPMILVRTGPVVEELLTDPWIRDASVTLKWPTHVSVEVEERVPRAWVETATGWARRSEDGFALPGPARDDSLGSISLPDLPDEEAPDSEALLGSIEFLMALPEDVAKGTTIRFQDGELWANVEGFEVRLGRGVRMREKAISVMALLNEGLAEGTVIVMVAPENPAIEPPPGGDGPGEGEEDGTENENDESGEG